MLDHSAIREYHQPLMRRMVDRILVLIGGAPDFDAAAESIVILLIGQMTAIQNKPGTWLNDHFGLGHELQLAFYGKSCSGTHDKVLIELHAEVPSFICGDNKRYLSVTGNVVTHVVVHIAQILHHGGAVHDSHLKRRNMPG